MPISILVINTGSTSTKMAVYIDKENVLQREYQHDSAVLKQYPYMVDQLPMRQALAEAFVAQEAAAFAPFDVVVSRGGILCPIYPGGYEINPCMIDYLENVCTEEHASNLAAAIAYKLQAKFGIPRAYIYDGITADELTPVARISGIPDMPRVSITHALNMRAIAHKAAADLGRRYGACTIVVAHLGGGISLSLHHQGRVEDIVSDDEGPFSPERAGGQQGIRLIKYMENKPTLLEKLKVMRGGSGLIAYFGTNDARQVEALYAAGDALAKDVYDALALQVAKSIAGLAAAVCGRVDCIALTGGLAHSALLTGMITERTAFIAQTRVYPGENEMEALAHGAYRILNGEETARPFTYEKT